MNSVLSKSRSIVIVRHMESEGNIANSAFHNGDLSVKERLGNVSPANYRLSKKGRIQGEEIGRFLSKHFPNFDRCLTSDMVRAVETALLVNRQGSTCPKESTGIGWEVSPLLRERSWGDIERFVGPETLADMREQRDIEDVFTWNPPNGELFTTTMIRAREILRTVHSREEGTTLIVTHGEALLAIRAVIEGQSAVHTNGKHDFTELPHNGAVIQYRKRIYLPHVENPFFFEEVRSTSKETFTQFGEWREISTKEHSPESLQAYIEKYPHVLE